MRREANLATARMFRHNHIEAHQLLVFPFARIKTDDIVARQLPYCEAVRREAGPVARTRGEHADGVGVWERSGAGTGTGTSGEGEGCSELHSHVGRRRVSTDSQQCSLAQGGSILKGKGHHSRESAEFTEVSAQIPLLPCKHETEN